MLTLFRKLFGQSQPEPPVTVLPPAIVVPEPGAIMPSVEVVHLSLAAIIGRLPDDLKALVLQSPNENATVALPMPTIVKQLPGGSVKMSLASLHRQAAAGIFAPLIPGDKRMVEVPLSEVFRHVRPSLLRRRADQRPCEVPEDGFGLFGNAENPHEMASAAPDHPAQTVAAQPEFPLARPRMLKMEAQGTLSPLPPPAEYVPEFKLNRDPQPAVPNAPSIIAPPPEVSEPASEAAELPPSARAPKPPRSEQPSLLLPVGPLAGAWPETIRQELAALNGSAAVALPASDVTAGLARGKVTFTWGQIRSWLQPELEAPSAADEATVLTLPLKVVAPVFLAAARKPKVEPTHFAPDESIPTLFNGTRHVEPAAVPAAEPLPVFTPEELPSAPAEDAPKEANVLGAAFGQPGKSEWTPVEMIAHLTKLPGVAGAVVALQEGLLVAQSMPADLKGETVAAFLPQIFARLNQYSGEMKLGEVDDLLFTTRGAHCQIYRLGYVYFAVLGKPGEALPWPEIRLISDELVKQTRTA
ncbi:MAG: hypothetical protein QOE70_19 [Chthoniobacter sp.]|nr:hypothetical protein [Chthoniobacter sp.]